MQNNSSKDTLKIVYYGPGVAGSTTNILYIASQCVQAPEPVSGLYGYFDFAESVLYEYFKLTDVSLKWLEEDGMPKIVLNSLYPLRDHKFCSGETFWQAIQDAIGVKQTANYRQRIEHYAHVTNRVFGLTIDSTKFYSVGIDSFAQDITQINCYKPPFSIYRDPLRREVLEGVHGIIFVADSQRDRMAANIEMVGELEHHLRSYGSTLASFPWVIQYNKRDLPNILPVDMLEGQLNRHHVPHVEAIAVKGVGGY